ncbi:MAG: LysM domain-containing protein [Opitutus sp.]|nr:LysM domain-containing protein [Opitutus sp.]
MRRPHQGSRRKIRRGQASLRTAQHRHRREKATCRRPRRGPQGSGPPSIRAGRPARQSHRARSSPETRHRTGRRPPRARCRKSQSRHRRKRHQSRRLRAARDAAAKTPPVASPAEPRIHVVRVGDTLEKIAKQYYGSSDRWRTIYTVNNALLSGGRPLKPGMELEIPVE